jgi:hypothetical protein
MSRIYLKVNGYGKPLDVSIRRFEYGSVTAIFLNAGKLQGQQPLCSSYCA